MNPLSAPSISGPVVLVQPATRPAKGSRPAVVDLELFNFRRAVSKAIDPDVPSGTSLNRIVLVGAHLSHGAGRAARAHEVAKAIGRDEDLVTGILDDLTEQGLLERVGRRGWDHKPQFEYLPRLDADDTIGIATNGEDVN